MREKIGWRRLDGKRKTGDDMKNWNVCWRQKGREGRMRLKG